MSDGKILVELYYDVMSPYSWHGFEILTRYRKQWKNMDLQLKPFSLPGIMKVSGNRSPAVVPNKAMYMIKDLLRLAKYNNIPMNIPSDVRHVMFEKGSRSAQLLLTSVNMDYPQYTEELSRQLWMRIWSRDEDITEEDSLREAARRAGIADDVISNVLKKSKKEATASRLQAVTDDALSCGAFGAPTIIAYVNGEKEMIFGSDRFQLLGNLIGEKYEGPLAELSQIK